MLKRVYTDDEVNKLLSTVEAEFGAHLQKSESEILAKSETTEVVEETQPLNKAEDEDCDLDEDTKKELEKAYCDMSKGEKKTHMEMLKRAMGDETEMQKSEESTVVAAKEEEIETLKKSLEEIQKKNEELEATTTTLVAAMKKRFTVPPQKSVTELAMMRKSEDTEPKALTKAQIDTVLTNKAKDPTLKKSDREAINNFYRSGSLEKVQHLLK